MLNNISCARLLSAWFAVVTVAFACRVVLGAPMTLGATELWLVVCLVPPVVMRLVWRDAPSATVAELLHTVDTSVKAGRP